MSSVAEIAGMAGAKSERDERLVRALRSLRISGRRLMKVKAGWGVMPNGDRRVRPRIFVEAEDVERLARDGSIKAVEDGVYVLADVDVEMWPERQPWAFIAAGIRKNTRSAGGGFAALAMKARRGEGPLTLRHVQAGVRLVTDAELQDNSGGLTMDWDAGPIDRQRRGASAGPMKAGAAGAAKRLKRVRAAMDERQWRIAWVLCVGGLSLRKVRAQFALGQGKTHDVIVQAMEALADAYES